MPRILLTDGDQRATLAATRSLGQAGHAVFVCSHRQHSLAGVSKYCQAHAAIADPLSDVAEYASQIRELIDRWRIDVLLPVTEASLLAVLAHPDLFQDVCVPFPDERTFRRISDKAEVITQARTLGLSVPRQQVLHHATEEVECRYPVVVKPSRSVVGQNGKRIKTGAAHADDFEGVTRILRATPADAFPVLVQERIVGPGIGVFVLLWKGQVLASFGHRRIREKPPWGGISVFRESVQVDRELLDASVALLRAFDWSGVAMVEYKIDSATGRPYVMEINGRLWGSLQLAIDAGVDFPVKLVNAAIGNANTACPNYRVGIRSRWWWGDIDHLIAVLRHSRAELGLPPGAPGRARAIIDFLSAFAPGNRNEVFRLFDPLPAMLESIDWLARR
jgi:predicted ATP-grasp superfamily ATP-dependent carboligase